MTATMSSAVDRSPKVPGHPIGVCSIGSIRRAWCGCGWRWLQPDPTMLLAEARKAEREAIQVHRILAAGPVEPDEGWVRDRG
jgi:hypothetical protein